MIDTIKKTLNLLEKKVRDYINQVSKGKEHFNSSFLIRILLVE